MKIVLQRKTPNTRRLWTAQYSWPRNLANGLVDWLPRTIGMIIRANPHTKKGLEIMRKIRLTATLTSVSLIFL